MRLSDVLFNDDFLRFKAFAIAGSSGPFLAWEVNPLDLKVLSKAGDFDRGAHLLLAAFLVAGQEPLERCYIDLSLPERVSERVYFKNGGSIIESNRWDLTAEVIPEVAIAYPGDYELFYSRQNPAVGIDVLERGLALTEDRFAIAQDLAYILRDEGKFQEAIDAFSIAISEDSSNYFLFIERASLFERVGDLRQAENDWAIVEKTAGPDTVALYRASSG